MMSAVTALLSKFPVPLTSRLALLLSLSTLLWLGVQQSSATTHAEVQRTQFEQIIATQAELGKKIDKLEERIDAALLMQAARNQRQDVRDLRQDARDAAQARR